MSIALPEITHLQALVLEALAAEPHAGRDVRALLVERGIKNSAPAFYQMMGRLEDAGFVEGWYDQKLVNGENVKGRHYRITRRGERALAETRAFYLERPFMLRPAKRGSHG